MIGSSWLLWKHGILTTTEPSFCNSVTLAGRAESLATASTAVSYCMLLFLPVLSILALVDRLTGARTRMELMIGARLGSSL
ncbi:hypothetical protein QL285_096439 [Trifolium repens]|nr:hypothetical protein QL285_096438 [Trifolium repens]KAK2352309.1 hypothetical protein QL285_096439 [Trifolium repens]